MHFDRLRLSIILFMGTLVIGIVGFMVFEGLAFADAVYLALVTIATVGYVLFIYYTRHGYTRLI